MANRPPSQKMALLVHIKTIARTTFPPASLSNTCREPCSVSGEFKAQKLCNFKLLWLHAPLAATKPWNPRSKELLETRAEF